MKFNIKKSVLQEALQIAISAIPNKSTLQILNDYSLRLEGNTLEICATDLNLGVRIKLEVEGERDGETLINARKFSDLVKALVPSCENVSIDVQDHLTRIKWSEKGQASITSFDASDFPPFPEVEGNTLTLAASELACSWKPRTARFPWSLPTVTAWAAQASNRKVQTSNPA